MFKGYGWLKDSNMTWEDYWKAFRKYNHALYITNVSKVIPQEHTELNYQFISTLDISDNEFRPADLPDGWDHSPYDDEREWLTERTEAEYYNLCCDEEYRLNYFLKALKAKGYDKDTRLYRLARIRVLLCLRRQMAIPMNPSSTTAAFTNAATSFPNQAEREPTHIPFWA